MKIIKTHRLTRWQVRTGVLVCTYRHPVDCISSNLLFLEKDATEANIREQIRLLKENGLEQLCNLPPRKNILRLKYEDFYKDHSVIFSELERFFNIQLNDAKQQAISDKYQVEQVKEKFTSKFDHAFEFDKVSHWHGNHISDYKGRPNAAAEVFTTEQLRLIESELNSYMEALGYETRGK